ncbi:putative T7SS-secreted protein [Streptomyces albidoflavus]|uniref:putative T7SS-secreted protein n=1 Tax=Streptomyces albidoflavus TaxID=1886 RepID=UPI00331B250E
MARRPTDWDPIHDGDPIPGDPYEVAKLGKDLRDMADAIKEQSAAIDALATVEGWDSDAGRAFHEIAGDTAGRLKRAYDRYDEAATAMGTKVTDGAKNYASQLNRAQELADKARTRAMTANEKYQEALDKVGPRGTVQPPNSELSPAEQKRYEEQRDDNYDIVVDCIRDVSEAKEIRDDAAKDAQKKIKNIIHHDGVRDPGGVMNWLADWADGLSSLSAILSTIAVICAFIPGGQILAAVFAAAAAITSALALAGHAYDKWARGGDVSWLKIGVDVLGLVPGFGLLKGFSALKGLKGLRGLGPVVTNAGRGVRDMFFNGFAVKTVNAILKKTGRTPLAGRDITAAIKGAGLISAVYKIATGQIGESTGDPGDTRGPVPEQRPKPTPPPTAPPAESGPTPTPSPSPGPSPQPFHAALAA